VKRHIETVMAKAPCRALSTLKNDAAELISSGMIILNAKLSASELELLKCFVSSDKFNEPMQGKEAKKAIKQSDSETLHQGR
jgi:hypothetical protein